MELLLSGLNRVETLISENPTKAQVSHIVNSLDWTNFNAVILRNNEGNWLEVSGSLDNDGFAIIYEENGVPFISEDAPEKLVQLENALQSYLFGNEKFKDKGFIALDEPVTKKQELKNIPLWKFIYQTQRENNRYNLVIGIGFVIFLVIIILVIYQRLYG